MLSGVEHSGVPARGSVLLAFLPLERSVAARDLRPLQRWL